MKKHYPLVLAVIALLFQGLPMIWLRYMPNWYFGKAAFLPESMERPLSIVVLLLWVLISLGLGNTALYLLLRKKRLRVALPMILVCCVPTLIAGMVYLHSLLVFLAVY